ncbi:hypothetical protein HHL19_32340 [Streptomyces sp. R302]|uniref:hypothetical protein n=1 Tax=unclassified Streptomyces TaxID=2593676 RepID=UPI00145D6CDC|nr:MULTISPECIES: hypothetical protein [unclassified Streptomyces]NML53949.1 hypothetical protein [Streptomyces sp. R301]NML83209.1 hypothetical protein [Streptomyces sp. R302]
MEHTNRRRLAPLDLAAVLLAAAGIAAAPVSWYLGTTLSVIAAGVIAASLWLVHRPITSLTRAAMVMVGAGLVLQLVIALVFTPAVTESVT